MLVNIKIHSAFSKHFNGQRELRTDLNTYSDVILYLQSMHPSFSKYMKKVELNQCDEGICYLDKNLKMLSYEDMLIRKAHTDDTIYIVPGIAGGGGKRGIFFMLAAVALSFMFPPLGAALSGIGSAAGGAITGTAGELTLGQIATKLLINVGLSLLTKLFLKSPESNQGENVRQNDLFGGLQNTISSGTPVPLHYGLVRFTGQFISGDVQTEQHGRNANITVGSKF